MDQEQTKAESNTQYVYCPHAWCSNFVNPGHCQEHIFPPRCKLYDIKPGEAWSIDHGALELTKGRGPMSDASWLSRNFVKRNK